MAVAVAGTRFGLVNMGPTALRATATEQALAFGRAIAEGAPTRRRTAEGPPPAGGTW